MEKQAKELTIWAEIVILARMKKQRLRRFESGEELADIALSFEDFHLLRMEADAPSAYEYPAHLHKRFELILVIHGPYCCRLNESELRLEQGELLLIQPGDYHQDHLRRGQLHYVLHFRLTTGCETPFPLLSSSCPPEARVLQCGDWDPLRFFQWMEREAAGDETLSPLAEYQRMQIQDARFAQFFWEMVSRYSEDLLSGEFKQLSYQERFSRSLMRIFDEHVKSDLSVDRMAELLGMSRRSLSDSCRRFLGESPARLFLDYRLKRAETYLSSSSMSIQEISYLLGFGNPYHFSRSFHRRRGLAPSRWRALHRED